MLSSRCSARLLPLLNQALHGCKEEERQLEEQLRRCRRLLADWKTDSSNTLDPDHPASEPQECPPSAKEVQEVELLNKALEKAFKVRGTSKKEEPAAPAPTPTMKEKSIKPLSKPSNPGAKPATYLLKAPYKTMPEKSRPRGAGRAVSANKSAGMKPVPVGKDNFGFPMHTTTVPTPLKPTTPPSTAPDEASPQQPDRKQPKALSLQDKGPTLKLPVAYQQAYIRSSRLWEKYYEIQDHLPASRPSFIQRLQTTFIPESPELSLPEIEDWVARLQRAVRSLERRIDIASEWEGSGPARWRDYRTLLMLEALQDEVDKSHSELQKLQRVTEQYKSWCERLSIIPARPEVTLCPSAHRATRTVLTYSHPEELRQLTASRLRALELQEKVYLLKVQSEELLPEARSGGGGLGWSPLLLRGLYSQLCEGGEAFPVLVQDDG